MKNLLLPLLLLVSSVAFAVTPPSVTLTWTAPTTNVDNTPITGAITYSVNQYVSGVWKPIQTGIVGTTVVITSGVTAGTTQCYEVGSTVAGINSKTLSNQACKVIPAAPVVTETPQPPSKAAAK
jgi:hypothetical protein